MTFTFDGTTLEASGNLAPEAISGNLEQRGSVLRTFTGRGTSNRIWSKWAFSFSWVQAPDEVGTKLKAMVEWEGIITFTDTTIGDYTFILTDDSLQVGDTAFGVGDASAIFREQ